MTYAFKKKIVLFSLAASLVAGAAVCTYQSIKSSIDNQDAKANAIEGKYQQIVNGQHVLKREEAPDGRSFTLGLWKAPTGHLYAVSGDWSPDVDTVALCPIKQLSDYLFEPSSGSTLELYENASQKLTKHSLSPSGAYEHDVIIVGAYMGEKDHVKELHAQPNDPYFPAGKVRQACEETLVELQTYMNQTGARLVIQKADIR